MAARKIINPPMNNKFLWKQTLSWVVIFSIAMGFLETAVVIYLRRIYYHQGFCFPLAPLDPSLVSIEAGREVATLIMLICISVIAGKKSISRFAYFLLSFAVWDIFYYIFLKLLIGWPSSLMTRDVLFLVPVTWIGPVLAPVLISLTMIGLALFIIIAEGKGKKVRIDRPVWVMLIAGALVLMLSFMWNDSSDYNWLLFIFGELLIITGIVRMIFRSGLFPAKRADNNIQ